MEVSQITLTKPNFKKEKVYTWIKSNFFASHGFDKADVFLLSTALSTGNVTLFLEVITNQLNKLTMINEYTKLMGGLDHCDQYLGFYRLQCKTKWKKQQQKNVMFIMTNLEIINASILFGCINLELTRNNCSHVHLGELLIHELVHSLPDAGADPYVA